MNMFIFMCLLLGLPKHDVALMEDAYWLGVAIQGEGYHLVNEQSAWYLADTIFNRIDIGWCDTIEQCVKQAYWGWENGERWLTEDTLWLALDILGNRHRRDRLQIIYAFSLYDVAGHNIPAKNAVAIECSDDGVWCLHFYGDEVWD